MIDVITMSSKGQFVIPKSIREEMGIKEQDKFVIVRDKELVILKKIESIKPNKKIFDLLDKFSKEFQKAGITPEDVKEEIRRARE